MSEIKGNLSIHSENIFPIIKKWLYSDHDIFIRELVSNASDAITKMKRLASLGEADLKGDDNFKITVTYDDENKTIAIEDNGIGMTADEIQEYINQIAFSGAEAFVEKFKDKEDKDQIIGHFGLGFYSAFMVAKQVTIDTLSYIDGAEPAFWSCDGGTEFTISDSNRTTRGTTVTLYLGDDGEDFKNQYKIKNTLTKYCGFMPYPIFFDVVGIAKPETEATPDTADDKTDDVPEVIEPINNTTPLYLKSPSQIEEKEYRDFYRDTFMDFKEPLFWIHLNMDYPFRLKGILYFPKLNSEFDGIEGQIKLYNTQVYIADNIKEVIPEFLLLLKGVIDCPDLPLNVSRSFLQNDGFVKKVQDYITKKVADKLNGLNKTDRENYEKFWNDINPFVKFGALKDDKFYDKIKDSILYKTTADVYNTLPDYQAAIGNKTKGDIYYTSDPVQQAQYIALLKEHEIDVLILDERIDQAFISFIESKLEDVNFKRVDADVSELLTDEAEKKDEEGEKKIIEALVSLYKRVLAKDDIKVELKALKSQDVAAMITLSESNRRMQDMMKMYALGGMGGEMPSDETLVLNKNHKLVKYTLEHMYEQDDLADLVAEQLYDLAVLSHKPLSGEQMNAFIKRSNQIMEKLV